MLINIALVLITIFLLVLAYTVLVHIFFLVPYVPSKKRVVEKMISLARLKPQETVVDLGCGDARLLIAAEKKANVKAIGFEIAPLMYLLSVLRKKIANAKAKIYFKSLFDANLRKANVIFCYLLPGVMPRLARKIKHECKRGTRVISNTFHIPGLKLKKTFEKNVKLGLPTIYVYEV